MGEVLSQEEIDALLSAITTGEVDAEVAKQEETMRRVKQYDFRRPDKFSKDQLRTLEMLHDNFARHLSTSLATYLRALVDVRLVSVQQMTYDEFIRSLPNPTVMSVFSLAPLTGSAIMEVNPELALMIVQRLLGGQVQYPEKPRELTDIELTILRRVLVRSLDDFREAWHTVLDVNAELQQTEMNPQFVQIVAPSQMVILITFTVKTGDHEGFINVCLPDTLLEPILPKLSAHYWLGSTRQAVSPEVLQQLKQKIQRTKVDVVVVIGQTQLVIRDLLTLQVGDVIPIPTHVDAPFEVQVGTKLKFRARPGVVGKRLAVQVVKVEREGVDIDE